MPQRIAGGMSEPSRAEVDSGAGVVRLPNRTQWRFMVLVEIANFAMLRRHVGLARAETLAGDVVLALKSLGGHFDVFVRAQDRIELSLVGTARGELDELVADCVAVFSEPRPLDCERHLIELNVGAAAATARICDEVQLVEEAEQALIESRNERRPVVREVGRTVVGLDRIALGRDMPLAIERGEFFLQYQPKLHVRQQKISSVEALIRWSHPRRGLVMPNDFIPLAEETRDIGRMTLWTIRQAIADQRVLVERGYDLRVFINIAGALLTDTAFVRQACALIAPSGAKLGFEVTETSVIRDPQSAIANLNTFADIGITIAIDDYGAGLSSLAYLKQLPARELKIDKLFVTQLTSSNRDPLIIRSTIDLAHALEMEVVAEGVEAHAALALLAVMGCDMVQGFLISRPITLDALIEFLAIDTAPMLERPSIPQIGSWMRA